MPNFILSYLLWSVITEFVPIGNIPQTDGQNVCHAFSEKTQSVIQPVNIHIFILTQNDPSVGIVTDAETMKQLATQIQKDLEDEGVIVATHLFHDESFSLLEFERTVQSLNIVANDVLWFYYSGHGRNYDAWPQTHESESSQTEIHNVLKNQNPRLAISFFDCCNWDTTIVKPLTVPFCDDGPYFEKLFLESRGDLMISSAKPGKFAYGRLETGGIFTNSFYSYSVCTSSWLEWLQSSRRKTSVLASQMEREQEPIYLFSDDFIDGGSR